MDTSNLINMLKNESDLYASECGYTMSREYGLTPRGNAMAGKWVLRDGTSALIDFDQYRCDLAERNSLNLISEKE